MGRAAAEVPRLSRVCCWSKDPRALSKTFDLCESPGGFLVVHLQSSPTTAANDITCPSRPGSQPGPRSPPCHVQAMGSTSMGRR